LSRYGASSVQAVPVNVIPIGIGLALKPSGSGGQFDGDLNNQ